MGLLLRRHTPTYVHCAGVERGVYKRAITNIEGGLIPEWGCISGTLQDIHHLTFAI